MPSVYYGSRGRGEGDEESDLDMLVVDDGDWRFHDTIAVDACDPAGGRVRRRKAAVIQSPAMTLRRMFWPTAITLFGAFLRWHRLGDFVLNVDHAYPISQAIGLLQAGRWPALGQDTSVLFANPPGMPYMVLLPLWATGTVWGVHSFVVGLNLLAVPLIYRFVRRQCGEAEALAAAWLAAISPWLVHYSQGTWVQGLLPLGTTLTFVLLIEGLRGSPRGRARSVFAGLAAFTALTQLYLLAFLTAAQVGPILLLNRRRLAWRGVIAGLTIFSAATGLFLYQLAADWENQAPRVTRFLNPEATLTVGTTALAHALRYVTGSDYEIVYGSEASTAWQMRRTVSRTVAATLLVCVMAGVGRALWRIRRGTADAPLWLASLVWLSVPIAAMTVTRQPVHVVYLLLTVPAGFVLAAPVLAALVRGRWAIVAGAALALNSFLLLHAGSLKAAARPAGSDLDRVTLRASLLLGSEVAEQTSAYGVGEVYASLPPTTLTAWARRPLTTVSWFIDPELLIIPQGRPAIYLRLGHGTAPAPFPLAERVETIAFPGDDFVAFDVFPALDRPAMLALPQVPLDWPSDTGLTLLGYTASDGLRAGGPVTVVTYWLTEALAETRGHFIYGPYVHLDAVDGPVHLNVGAPGLPGYYYRMGDLYVQPLTFTLPEDAPSGEYRLELGLYDGVHSMGTTFHPPDGVPVPFHVTSLTVP